ncbi:MAG TPA: hypothetical protein VGK70_05670, partial [Thermoanaerobaculia bacterium]
EITVWTRCDPTRTADNEWDRKLGNRAARGDPCDLAGAALGKPNVAVRSRRYSERGTVRGWDRELCNRAICSDSPYSAADEFGKPKRSISTGRNTMGL